MLLTGPAQEQCDLVFFPISSASGLKNILVFPKKHLILIDHDCISVTLFEVRDLWREAPRTFFFPSIAGQVRDMVGQQLE